MNRNTFLLSAVITVFVVGISFSCSKSGSGSKASGSGNDPVLASIGNDIILPAYISLSVSVTSLDSAITDLNASPNSTKIANVQALFKTVYIAWTAASEYNGFGPAYSNQPNLAGLNHFPTSTTLIESNITGGNYNVNAFANASAKGFPALDYLLFGYGGNTLINYTTDAAAANRKQYLAAVSADIKTEVNATLKGWQASGGNYINTFINGTGNSISSSLGLMINSLDQDFEILKNDCLGIPLGKQPPGQTLPVLPNEVEAYYSGISAQLATAQLKAVQNLYLNGLSNYVIKANAKYGNGLLNDTLKAEFTSAANGMQAIPDPFSVTIQNNAAPAIAVYTTVQQLVVLLKTDMPSALGVEITYGDNDGD